MVALQHPHCGVLGVLTIGRKGDGSVGHAVELSGAQRPRGGGAKEQHWGCGASGADFWGRSATVSGLKKKVTINMFVGEGMWQCAGVGGDTASTRVDVVVRPQGGGCSNNGGNGGGDAFAIAATKANVGQRNEIGWGEEEDMVPTVAAMSSCTT